MLQRRPTDSRGIRGILRNHSLRYDAFNFAIQSSTIAGQFAMNALPNAIVEMVWRRAGNRCEYCRLHQDESRLRFHIDHIISRQHGGSDDIANLCLACSHCNLQKGPNLSGLLEGKLYSLFNPRKQNWHRHFEWDQTSL